MNQALLNFVSRDNLKDRPQIKVGQTVKVHQKIKEGGKERIQVFQGLVIQVSGDKGINQTFTVRTTLSGVGVEKVFPVHSDTVAKVEIVKQSKVRRAKLYYMRERSGKSARLREIKQDSETLNKIILASDIHPEVEAMMPKEEVKAEEPKEEVNAEEPKEEVNAEEPKEEAKAEEPKQD